MNFDHHCLRELPWLDCVGKVYIYLNELLRASSTEFGNDDGYLFDVEEITMRSGQSWREMRSEKSTDRRECLRVLRTKGNRRCSLRRHHRGSTAVTMEDRQQSSLTDRNWATRIECATRTNLEFVPSRISSYVACCKQGLSSARAQYLRKWRSQWCYVSIEAALELQLAYSSSEGVKTESIANNLFLRLYGKELTSKECLYHTSDFQWP